MELVRSMMCPTVRVRYFAHNTLEISLPSGKTLVVDPCLPKAGPFRCGYETDVIEGCDYVFVNHSHGDHVETLGELYDRFHPLIMAHASTCYDLAKFYDIPYIRFIPYVQGDSYDFDCFKIDILPGRHNNVIPGMFMVRPSGKMDDYAKAGALQKTVCRSELEAELMDLGTLYGNNFLLTLPNNLRIGFFAGNPGMTDPQDKNLWKTIHPEILFAHRAKFGSDHWAEKMADALEVTGAQVMIPIHIEDAYAGKETFSGKYDPVEYVGEINRIAEERGLNGRALFMEKAKWYQFGMSVSQC